MQDSNPYRDPKQKRVLIIGGGAAGFFTAIKIVEEDPSIAVTILEQGKDVADNILGTTLANADISVYSPFL